MLQEQDIAFELVCQEYHCKTYLSNADETKSVFVFESRQRAKDVVCPYCGSSVHICESVSRSLQDVPIWSDTAQELCFVGHRYRCTKCGRKHTPPLPLQYPGTRITERAATWIRTMLLNKLPTKSVQKLTGIHWETIRNIHRETMNETLREHQAALKAGGYHPHFLAVDEFAIRKGHSYATSVMDLETGEVLWIGEGRSKEDFRRFFDEIDPSFTTEVIAVAMDMNASYHIVVQEKLPQAQIVYDRYHMQAQYGREVLGTVRLDEARKHKAASKELSEQLSGLPDEEKRHVKAQIREEKNQYREMKKLRWTLLTNGENLSDTRAASLQAILETHSDLAVCYAMKEEMISLFKLRDAVQAQIGWRNWFSAAKASGIPALVSFAERKEKRINGLAAHATYPISTGKLEGFNNKIKVAKRVGYGYRDDDYFFLLVRFLSLPSPRKT